MARRGDGEHIRALLPLADGGSWQPDSNQIPGRSLQVGLQMVEHPGPRRPQRRQERGGGRQLPRLEAPTVSSASGSSSAVVRRHRGRGSLGENHLAGLDGAQAVERPAGTCGRTRQVPISRLRTLPGANRTLKSLPAARPPGLRSSGPMASAVGAALVLAVLAQLPPLFLCAAPAGLSQDGTFGTHSLCYDITINSKPTPGQQWCTVHVHVDQKNFLSYDCGTDKVIFFGALGGKVNVTITWEEHNNMLKEMRDILKQKLADIKAENPMAKGLNTLEGRMSCQLKSHGSTSSSWQIGFNGQMWLHFNSHNRRWTEVHPGSDWMKKIWQNDREVTEFLHKSSKGDCRAWLEKFLVQRKTELEPTGSSSNSPKAVFHKLIAIKCISLALSLWIIDLI